MKILISKLLIMFPRIVCYASFFLIKRHRSNVKKSLRIFVLDEFRFREDIKILRERSDIDFIDFPNILQDKIVGMILWANNRNSNLLEVELKKFVVFFCSIYRTEGFISAGMYYKRHEAWEKATLLADKSFYCLHREGVGCDYEFMQTNMNKFINSARKFQGSKVFVATKGFKRFLIENNYLNEDKICVTGLPRFDKIYHLKSKSIIESKVLVFFSFFVGTVKDYGKTGLYPEDEGFRLFFDSVHGVIAEYAINNPDVKVYIKPKWYEGDAKKNIDTAIRNFTKCDPLNISNLQITDKIPAQDLIKKANTVVGFNSTTLIEALLYEKKVIMPIYHEGLENLHDQVFYSKYPKVLDFPKSPEALVESLDNCLGNSILPQTMDSDFISDVAGFYDGLNCERISKEIKNHYVLN